MNGVRFKIPCRRDEFRDNLIECRTIENVDGSSCFSGRSAVIKRKLEIQELTRQSKARLGEKHSLRRR